jgi:hypothetical protein
MGRSLLSGVGDAVGDGVDNGAGVCVGDGVHVVQILKQFMLYKCPIANTNVATPQMQNKTHRCNTHSANKTQLQTFASSDA